METGYNLNNGTLFADTGALFHRQSWVGLQQPVYGSLTFGRHYEPSFRIVYPTAPFYVNEVMSPISAMVLAVDRNTLSTQYDPSASTTRCRSAPASTRVRDT